MNKTIKFLKSFLFVLIWLIVSSYLEKYWQILHWEFIFLSTNKIFDHIFWFTLKQSLFNFDLGFYLQEFFEFATYEIPKEIFKFVPIYLLLKSTWKRNSNK